MSEFARLVVGCHLITGLLVVWSEREQFRGSCVSIMYGRCRSPFDAVVLVLVHGYDVEWGARDEPGLRRNPLADL